MKITKYYLYVILLWLFSYSVVAMEFPDHTLLGFDDYPPYMYLQNDTPAGIYPDIVTEAFRKVNLEIHIVILPWKRALKLAELGKAGLIGLLKTPERQKFLEFSEDFFSETLVFLVKSGNKFPYNSIKDIYGKSVGINQGFTHGEEFNHAREQGLIKVSDASTDTSNFQRLAAGYVDLIISDKLTAQQIMKKLNVSSDLEMLDTALSQVNVFIGFPHIKNKTEVLNKFNNAIRAMQQDGSLDKIVTKNLNI
jgi:polar amino acid transport system substrate-binding protein